MVEGSNTSFKKAVNAARFIIKSRTGLAIVKKSYQEKVDPISIKTSHLLKGFKEKEMRKLERDRTQFANNQTEKLKGDKGSESFMTKPMCDLKQRVQRPRLNIFEMQYQSNAVLHRRDIVPTFDKQSKLAWEDGENTTRIKQETKKTPTLTRKKILDHNMNSYNEEKRLEIWLNQVEVANIERRANTNGNNKNNRQKFIEKENMSTSKKLILPKCDDGKSQSRISNRHLELPEQEKSKSRESSVNLPKLGQSITPDSGRNKSQIEGSLRDPRFTRLIDSLTPSKNSLKLPQIVTKPNSRSA